MLHSTFFCKGVLQGALHIDESNENNTGEARQENREQLVGFYAYVCKIGAVEPWQHQDVHPANSQQVTNTQVRNLTVSAVRPLLRCSAQILLHIIMHQKGVIVSLQIIRQVDKTQRHDVS